MKKIGVFCGSKTGHDSVFAKTTEVLADKLTQKKLGLVYGGANVGLMAVLANQMLKLGSEVIGVIPHFFGKIELAHTGLTKLHLVDTMSQRKELIAELSDGFIMLPGGPGSLDEFFEMHTMAQLGFHAKPCAILNINGYYDPLLKFLDNAVTNGFMKAIHRDMVITTDSPEILVEKMLNYQAPMDKKWVS